MKFVHATSDFQRNSTLTKSEFNVYPEYALISEESHFFKWLGKNNSQYLKHSCFDAEVSHR